MKIQIFCMNDNNKCTAGMITTDKAHADQFIERKGKNGTTILVIIKK